MRKAFLTLLLVLAGAPALAQGAATLPGTCERLLIADQDLTGACRGSLLRVTTPTFTSFTLSGPDGRSLSFAVGGGAGDDTARPISLVTPGLTSREGVARSPMPAHGTCRIETVANETAIRCEAEAQGKRYAGAFRARTARDGAGAPAPDAGPARP